MKIKEILDDLLITGNTIAKIAKEKVHIGEKKLKEALNNAGYEYRNSGQKGWHYVGEGEEPLYTSVFEFIKSNNSHPKVKQTTSIHAFNVNQSSHDMKKDSHPIPLDVNSVRTQDKSSINTEFTPEERAILRDLIRGYVLNDQQDSHGDDLYQRVVTLEKREKGTEDDYHK
ncbi:hypothetical protein SOP94_26490 [Peribacillus frigoritolerans]|uniref:hypothetical protein n=1 Tax=Peribacillus frigoritolerans TaxID=450367 RepID=UPI002B256324|nr:hypothetical protein [Peribacillus frigoritolerans]MEB2631962.1 hypothetical protein [Peribacillus frigoritolerans]